MTLANGYAVACVLGVIGTVVAVYLWCRPAIPRRNRKEDDDGESLISVAELAQQCAARDPEPASASASEAQTSESFEKGEGESSDDFMDSKIRFGGEMVSYRERLARVGFVWPVSQDKAKGGWRWGVRRRG